GGGTLTGTPAAGGAGGFGGSAGATGPHTRSRGAGGAGAGMGGAIFNYGGTVTITDSTIAGNVALGGAAPGTAAGFGSGYGGGVFNLNDNDTLTKVTLADNTATNASGNTYDGAALYNLSDTFLVRTATVTTANTIFDSTSFRAAVVVDQQSADTATINATGPNISNGIINSGGTFSGTP